MDYRVFWDAAMEQIRQSISEQEFGLWFQRLSFIRSEPDGIVIGVPSSFYRDQVKFRYLETLQAKLSELYGGPVQIEFEVHVPDIGTPAQPLVPAETGRKPLADSGTAQAQPTGPARRVSATPKVHPQLNGNYTFENFVIGDNNSFAANAAVAVTKSPGTSYNPYLIYGGVGLGKTHLIQSIGNAIHEAWEGKKVIYVTMESFTNEFIDSIQSKKVNYFKNKYRHADVLLIDDIHFLQDKSGTQEELFHTFNALYDNNKQMVFTCDRPVSEIKDLTDRLRSRFERGLKVDLQPPNYETRFAILKKKIENLQVHIPDESLELISQNITTNVRDLEAALTKLIAFSELVGKEITPEITATQLKDFFSTNFHKNITIDQIQRNVAAYFNLSHQDLKSKKKTKTISFPRQIAMYIARDITEYSTTEIGLEFGGRDHTTVMHGHQRVIDRMKTDPTLEPIIKSLVRQIKESSSRR